MKKVVVLNLNYNKLKSIPNEISTLGIVKLHLANNKLDKLPDEAWGVKSVVWLELDNNNISHIPENIKNATDDQQFAFRFSVGGTFDTDNDYQRAIFTLSADGGTDDSRDANINNIFFTLNQGNATNEKGNGYAYFYNLHDSAKHSFVTLQTTTINVNGIYKMNFGGGVYDQTASVDGIRIFISNGTNIASAVFSLYGIKQL